VQLQFAQFWLSRLRSHHKANPKQKMAIIGFAHPPPSSGQENRIDKKNNRIALCRTKSLFLHVHIKSYIYDN